MTEGGGNKRGIEEREVDGLQFVGEQDGPVERKLKAGLVEVMRVDTNVMRGYLARVMSDGEPEVALCLVTRGGQVEPLVRRVHAVFAGIFSAANHLDIVVLGPEQQAQIDVVCRAFYPNPD